MASLHSLGRGLQGYLQFCCSATKLKFKSQNAKIKMTIQNSKLLHGADISTALLASLQGSDYIIALR